MMVAVEEIEVCKPKRGLHPTLGSFRLNHKGYPRLNGGPRRNQYVHRAVFEIVAVRPIREDCHIHHMASKLCWCPHQLLELPKALHPAQEPLRDPYTGQFLTIEAYERRYGEKPARFSDPGPA